MFLWARKLMNMETVEENYKTKFDTLNLGLFASIKNFLKTEFQKHNSRFIVCTRLEPTSLNNTHFPGLYGHSSLYTAVLLQKYLK